MLIDDLQNHLNLEFADESMTVNLRRLLDMGKTYIDIHAGQSDEGGGLVPLDYENDPEAQEILFAYVRRAMADDLAGFRADWNDRVLDLRMKYGQPI
jgi:hypothetical protein